MNKIILDVKRIKIEMANKKYTYKAVSDKTGISSSSISHIMARGTCNIANAGKLAEALNIDVSEIIKL